MARPRKKSFTDEVLGISTRDITGALKQSGTWGSWRPGLWSGGAMIREGLAIRRKSSHEVAISISAEGKAFIETVLPFSIVPGRLGGEYAQVRCPRCGRLRHRFYIHQALVACRECLKLAYRSDNRTHDQRRAYWRTRFPEGRPTGMHRTTWERYEARLS